MLEKHIFSKKSREFLVSMGYDEFMTLEQSLHYLSMRFENMCPHEIGVFLGIPLMDVLGFIEHKGDKYLFCRYWKVYHNPQRARSMFQQFDRAKINVMNSIFSTKESVRLGVETG
jgi:hypothetical protein